MGVTYKPTSNNIIYYTYVIRIMLWGLTIIIFIQTQISEQSIMYKISTNYKILKGESPDRRNGF